MTKKRLKLSGRRGQVATGPGDHRKNFFKCIGKLFEVFSKRSDVIQLLFLECDSGCPVETMLGERERNQGAQPLQ